MLRISLIGDIILMAMGLIFAFHLPVAIATHDTCTYLTNHFENIERYWDHDSALIITACLHNTSLLDAFDKTKPMSSSSVSLLKALSVEIIPELSKISEKLSSRSLNVLQTLVSRLTLETAFGYKNNTDSELRPQLELQLRQLKAVIKKLSDRANTLHGSFVERANQLIAEFNQIRDELKKILLPTRAFGSLRYCNFLGVTYENIKISLCNTVLTSSTLVTFSAFIVIVASIPLIVLSLVVSDRINSQIEKVYPENDSRNIVEEAIKRETYEEEVSKYEEKVGKFEKKVAELEKKLSEIKLENATNMGRIRELENTRNPVNSINICLDSGKNISLDTYKNKSTLEEGYRDKTNMSNNKSSTGSTLGTTIATKYKPHHNC